MSRKRKSTKQGERGITFFRAMTLVEVMVAIAVFSIGILGVLQVILSMMKVEDKTMIQTTATMLAQEGLHLVYHMRDTNRIMERKWDCVPNVRPGGETQQATQEHCLVTFGDLSSSTQGLRLGFSIGEKLPYVVDVVSLPSGFIERFEQTRLFLAHSLLPPTHSVISFYTLSPNEVSVSGAITPFARYVVFTGVAGFPALHGMLYKVSSHVLYMKGSVTGEVVLESFVGKLDKQQNIELPGTEEVFTIN